MTKTKRVRNGLVFTLNDSGKIIDVNPISKTISKNALNALIKIEKEKQENNFRRFDYESS